MKCPDERLNPTNDPYPAVNSTGDKTMAKGKNQNAQKPERVKLSPKETLKRMQEFPKRKERFVAAVRKGKNRSVSA
jgi:hypothetical protein